MREIRTSGSMSGDGNRDGLFAATAPILDSTEAPSSDRYGTVKTVPFQTSLKTSGIIRVRPPEAGSALF